ncbi:Membrane spanning protein [Bifidobacterium cuniculi]|uniref:Membrane spanning protein n=2 Tax=Bifidobacterium cuniculi TaxID=1688 RepID=A0A087ATG1_9BIFI|nr:Membrane spanning protein [Bifidobacterium cuniculi]
MGKVDKMAKKAAGAMTGKGGRVAGKHAANARTSVLGSISVVIVIAFVGFLIVTNMRVNRTAIVSSDAAELVEHQVQRVDGLQAEVNDLAAQVDSLSKQVTANGDADAEDSGSSTMLPAVEGPGVTVTLNDSSMWESAVDSSGSSADIDKYVVHQGDIEAVVDALWAGGAESMQIMDQRVLPTSAVICSGTLLLLQGRKYSPPYVISAIGPTQSMLDALDDSEAIRIYKQYVDAFGLGYEVEQEAHLEFAAAPMSLQPLQYAKVLQ